MRNDRSNPAASVPHPSCCPSQRMRPLGRPPPPPLGPPPLLPRPCAALPPPPALLLPAAELPLVLLVLLLELLPPSPLPPPMSGSSLPARLAACWRASSSASWRVALHIIRGWRHGCTPLGWGHECIQPGRGGVGQGRAEPPTSLGRTCPPPPAAGRPCRTGPGALPGPLLCLPIPRKHPPHSSNQSMCAPAHRRLRLVHCTPQPQGDAVSLGQALQTQEVQRI